jgi:hypothetical protein
LATAAELVEFFEEDQSMKSSWNEKGGVFQTWI